MHFVLLFLAGIVLFGCDSEPDAPTRAQQTTAKEAEAKPSEATPDTSTPRGVVEAYYAAIKSGDLKGAYALVSKADRQARTFEEFETGTSNPTQVALNEARTFTVNKARVEGDTARVYVDVEGPDVPALQRQLLAKYVNEGEKVPPPDELREILRKQISAEDTPQATSRVEVLLGREKDGPWRLDFDWDQVNPDRAVPEKSPPPKEKPKEETE